MKKVSIVIMGILFFLSVFILFPAWAANKGEEEDPEGKIPDKLDEKAMKELSRTAFVLKEPNGKEWLYIRLTSNQHLRIKVEYKTHGVQRVILTPRQRLAVKQALKLDRPVDKVILRVSEKRIHNAKGLGGYYLARSAADFKAWLQKHELEEKQEPAPQPDHVLLEKIKPIT
jgi:hypothetical protein